MYSSLSILKLPFSKGILKGLTKVPPVVIIATSFLAKVSYFSKPFSDIFLSSKKLSNIAALIILFFKFKFLIFVLSKIFFVCLMDELIKNLNNKMIIIAKMGIIKSNLFIFEDFLVFLLLSFSVDFLSHQYQVILVLVLYCLLLSLN